MNWVLYLTVNILAGSAYGFVKYVRNYVPEFRYTHFEPFLVLGTFVLAATNAVFVFMSLYHLDDALQFVFTFFMFLLWLMAFIYEYIDQ